jgi:hypothetical protein
VGISRIALDNLADFVYAFINGEIPDNPRDDLPIASTLKYAVEDLKSYYIEGITAQPGQENASSKKLDNWFWDETVCGQVLLTIKKTCESSPDEMLKITGTYFLVPGRRSH